MTKLTVSVDHLSTADIHGCVDQLSTADIHGCVDQLSTADIHGCVDQLSTADIHSFIDDPYASIVDIIHVATETCLPRTTYRSYLKPYWSGTIKKHHANMIFKCNISVDSGRPWSDEHESYREYKEAKREFRKYL